MDADNHMEHQDDAHLPGRDLRHKIYNRSAQVGVIGLGHVGLSLAVEMAQQGYCVTGIDIDRCRVDSVNTGISYNGELPDERLAAAVKKGTVRATQSLSAVKGLDAISICVPTPLRKSKDPDFSYVIASAEVIRNHLTPGKLIILESTTYPGMTRGVLLPILEQSGLKVGKDFFLAYSPERVDPGKETQMTQKTAKVVGGVTPHCTALATLLYQQCLDRIVPLSSSECAEMVKLLEISFRSVNLALANEMAAMCQKFNVNVGEILETTKATPFGFIPFSPGPEFAGRNLPFGYDYLTWKAMLKGFKPRLIELAAKINAQIPELTISRIADALNKQKKSLNGSRILALGVTQIRDGFDIRESPALEIISGLKAKGAEIAYTDPYVPRLDVDGDLLVSVNVAPQLLQSSDCVVILMDHSIFDYPLIVAHSRLILDCQNTLKDLSAANIIHF
jgi:UDP-N-acetyl-D-glucosamine dehydrogenase